MTHIEAIDRLTQLLTTTEQLRADAPIGPAVAETVRATAIGFINSYLADASTALGPTNVTNKE